MYSAHAPTTQRCKSVKPKLLEKFPEKNQRLMVLSQPRAKKEFISDELRRIMSVLAGNGAALWLKRIKHLCAEKRKKIHIKGGKCKILSQFGGKQLLFRKVASCE